MAASKRYFARANYRFLPIDQSLSGDAMIFELDESDVWSSAARPQSPDVRKARARISGIPATAASGIIGCPASLPVKVPDWSKMLKDKHRENLRRDIIDEDDAEEDGDRVPPHEYLARQMARARIASSSVHEGVGRTLKGRDLSRVRNAIWQKTGFVD
ncbi:hypothetical protein OROGR_024568 [Orobanche gracilis]